MIKQAIKYAKRKHEGQRRAFKDEPYFNHVKRVAKLVRQYTTNDFLICTAYLHDVIEDCLVDKNEFLDLFGRFIYEDVVALTNDTKLIKKYGKAEYLANKMLRMTPIQLLIKLCDRLDNVSSLDVSPEKFREKYKRETHYILDRLEDFYPLNTLHKDIIARIDLFI
jgi:(p)ppGpp synthase/HD superfamily hydrolase